MKKNMIFALSLMSLSLGLIACDERIKMAEESEIRKIVSEVMDPHFDKKTSITQCLAGQEKVPMGVNMCVELALYDFCKYLGPEGKMSCTLAHMNKDALKRKLLKDHPEAIDCLKKRGLMED